MFILFNTVYGPQGEVCPYQKEQFNVNTQMVPGKDNAQDFMVITIDMPEPEDELLASRIFICLDNSFDNLAYFLVEKSFEPMFMLCGVDEKGSHLNYGEAPSDKNELFRKVCDIYGNYFK